MLLFSQTAQTLNELQNTIKSLKEKNELLKKQLSYQTLRNSNLNEYYRNKSITLKNANQQELIFFKKNHEALKVCTLYHNIIN